MALLNAPEYDARKEKLKIATIVGSASTVALLILLTLAGYVMGHGWLFTNLPAEHKVDKFFTALEAKDYAKAYDLYTNGHPTDYSLQRFTEDWTTESPVGAPIRNHHVDISKTDGTGNFGTGIIVAVRINDTKKLFMWYQKSDGTLTEPAPHEIQY